MPETGQAAGMVYLGGDYYGDPGSQRTYDVRTKTYSTNYDWLVAELKREGKYVGTGQQLTPQQQAAQQEAQRRLAAEDYAREQQLRRGRFTARPTEPGAPIGVEAAKQAEQAAYREKVSIGQSMQQTTREEAGVIQRMLKSPTAQFGSQAAAQRGYELAARYDRSFAPSQVRATLAPQYTPQAPQQVPTRYFYPAPTEQAGIKPSFPTPAQKGSIAEQRGFYTIGAIRKLEGISSRLQSGFEKAIGYDERASAPIKAIAGFGSAFTGLPSFAGQMAGAGEAIIRYPSASLRGLPTGFKILSKQVSEQARIKPVEFAGSVAGMATIGRYAPKVSVPKPSSAGIRALARSETAILAPGRAKYEPLEMVKLKIQPSPEKPKLRPVMELEKPIVLKGLEQGIMTKSEFMAQQRTGLKATPLSQLRTLSEIKTAQRTKVKIIPYTQPITHTIISTKTKPITSTKQAIQTQPITKLRVKPVVSTVPAISTATMVSTKVQPIIKTKVQPITKVQTQVQTRTATRLRTQLRTQEVRKPKQIKPSISSIYKRSFKPTGARKFKKVLGGKTFRQLSAEIRRKL